MSTLRSFAVKPRADQVLSSRSSVTAHAVDEAQDTISQLFCAHQLTPLERTSVSMNLRSAHDSGVGLELLDYGEAVRIRVDDGLEDFHLVQIPLSGRATMDVGNAVVQSSSSVATLPPLDQGFTMRWGRGTPTLILYVQRDRLRDVAQQVYRLEHPDQLQLGLHMQMDTAAGRDFLRALVEWHDLLEVGTPDSGYARKLSAELMLARMLAAVENSASRALGAWREPEERRAVRGEALATRFVSAVEAGVETGAGVLDIAEQLGVPMRTLQDHVASALGSTPSAVLRDARMRRAHELLQQADMTRDTVTSIAERCGFGHLGRFASEYRKQFGESPAQTLRS